MINFRIAMLGMDGVMSNIRRLQKEQEAKAKRAVAKACLVVVGDAKRFCPVDTGRLRASITHEVVSGSEGKAGTNVHYGSYVEYGTKKQTAQPYLTPALMNNRDKIIRIYQEELKR